MFDSVFRSVCRLQTAQLLQPSRWGRISIVESERANGLPATALRSPRYLDTYLIWQQVNRLVRARRLPKISGFHTNSQSSQSLSRCGTHEPCSSIEGGIELCVTSQAPKRSCQRGEALSAFPWMDWPGKGTAAQLTTLNQPTGLPLG